MSVTDELKGMTEIALFAGAGGGVLGSKMLGLRTVAYVEWDAFPQAILKARMADGLIETAPVFGDVREFGTTPYAGKVDVVSGGFPCQPFSVAGRQEADFDPRNMWPATRDIVRSVRPKYAFLENVAGLLTGTHGYFGVVLGELAASGYDVVWTCLPAAAVGAPHRRDRLWILGRPREGNPSIIPDGTLVEFARFDPDAKAWCRFDGRCRGDTSSAVTSYIPFPRSGTVAVAPDGTTAVYALDPVAQADGTTRGGWPWPRILEDLRIPDPLAGARPAAPDSPGIEMLPTLNAFDARAVGASRRERRPEWGRHGVSLHHLAADWSARGGRTYPTPLAGNATPGEGGNHGGMALRAAAALKDMRGIEHDRTWVTPTAGISKEVVTPGMADRADRNRHPGNLLEDVAQSLYGDGADPPDTAWPEGRKTGPTPQVSRVSNDVNVRTAAQRSPDSPPNKLGWAVGEAEDGGSSIHDFRENLAADDVGDEADVSAMFRLAPRADYTPEQASPVEIDLDDLEDFASVEVKWHILRPIDSVSPGCFPTPTVGDAKYNEIDGWSPLGRLVRNNNARPPRRTKAEQAAARVNRGPVGQLNPDWVEWLMGWPVGWTSMSPMSEAEVQAYAENMPGSWWRREPPHIPRITVGTPDRAARLKACGNGQVALCASASFEILLETFRQISIACEHGPVEFDAADFLGL